MIVVIDDDREVRTLIELALARTGRSVVGYGDGPEAIDFLKRCGPDVELVVSDVVMEGFDAHRLIRHLRSQSATASTPVIFLTPYGEHDARGPSADDPAVQRLPTPFEVEQLRAMVEAAIARPRPQAAARDGATGFHTRDRFFALVDETLATSPPEASVALIVGTLGDEVSDETLSGIARVVASQLRAGDSAGRLSRNTFGVIHPRCGADGASAIGARIARAVRSDAACRNASLTLGIAVAVEPAAATAATLVAAAAAAAHESNGAAAIGVRTIEAQR